MSEAKNDRSIQAVLVLYRRKPSESEAYESLRQIFDSHPEIAQSTGLLLYDNSPAPERISDELPNWLEYVHNPQNGGLVAAYSEALSRAKAKNADWLMLLDQDTVLTEEYFAQAMDCTKTDNQDVRIAAVVPRLIEGGRLSSPFTRRMITDKAVPANVTGLARQRVSAFNSGAIIRVSALEQIGGFPEEFPIESLDHAVFHLLQERGGRIHIMEAQMEHLLSMNSLGDSMSLERYERVLAAEALCTRKYFGTWGRVRMRLRLLRSAVKQLCREKEKKFIPISLYYTFSPAMRRKDDSSGE